MNTSPVLVNCIFTATSDYHASVQIGANNAPDLAITVIHDSIFGICSYALPGNGRSSDISVQDRESLLIVARNEESRIIASGVFEVDTALVEQLGALLVPCAMHNLIVDQCEGAVIRRGLDLALANAALCEVTR